MKIAAYVLIGIALWDLVGGTGKYPIPVIGDYLNINTDILLGGAGVVLLMVAK